MIAKEWVYVVYLCNQSEGMQQFIEKLKNVTFELNQKKFKIVNDPMNKQANILKFIYI